MLARHDPAYRLNTVCPYYTMFPLVFPWRCLERAEAGEWVLDPFCGRGTTNFAARLRGLPSVGVDSSPVAAAVARAKLVDTTADAVIARCKAVLDEAPTPSDVPNGEFWTRCYHPRTLEAVCKLREHLREQGETAEDVVLRALILGVLHGPISKGQPSYLSNQMPRTYATKPEPAVRFWKKRGLRPAEVDVIGLVTRRAHYTLAHVPPVTQGTAVQADSRQLPEKLAPEPFRWVITSPPYFGMRSYVPDQWLRGWFLGGLSTVEYTQRGQVSHRADQFALDLAAVWRSTAQASAPGARLIVRFGALPSEEDDPKALLKESLALADCGWRIRTIRNAGTPPKGRRQADQFKRTTKAAVEEIDLYARLEP